jgi:predicted nucleic acid-binding protein
VTLLLWDASALSKRFIAEDGSDIVDDLLSLTPCSHAVTYLGYAESAAVLRRRFNSGRLTRQAFEDARERLLNSVLLSPRFELVTVEDADILAGMTLTDRHNINTSDAAILAAYLRLVRSPDGEEGSLVVSDHRLERAARNEGLATLDPARTNSEALTALGVL